MTSKSFLASQDGDFLLTVGLCSDFAAVPQSPQRWIDPAIVREYITPVESREVRHFRPAQAYAYRFLFSGATTTFANLLGTRTDAGIIKFDPTSNRAFINSLFIFEYYDRPDRYGQRRLATGYYHLQPWTLDSAFTGEPRLNSYLPILIAERDLPGLGQVWLKTKFFNGGTGRIHSFSVSGAPDVQGGQAENGLYRRLWLDQALGVYGTDTGTLSFTEMVEAAAWNTKVNAMQSVPVAQVPATPPGDFIGGQGQYVDTANPVSPGAVVPDGGTTIDTLDPTEQPLIFEVTTRQVQSIAVPGRTVTLPGGIIVNLPGTNINSDYTYTFYEIKVKLRHDNIYADRLFDQTSRIGNNINLIISPLVNMKTKLTNRRLTNVDMWGVRKGEGQSYLSDADGLEIDYFNHFNRSNTGGVRSSEAVLHLIFDVGEYNVNDENNASVNHEYTIQIDSVTLDDLVQPGENIELIPLIKTGVSGSQELFSESVNGILKTDIKYPTEEITPNT